MTTTTTVYTVDRLVLHPQCPNNVIGDHFPFPFAAAAEVSPLPVGCRVDASASHRLDSASASKRATLAYRGPVASCPLAPLLPFASRTPAGCYIACCCVPLPRVTFRRTAAAHVHPRPLLFVRDPRPLLFVHASWLSHQISLHCLHLLTRRRLMTGSVVADADAQA